MNKINIYVATHKKYFFPELPYYIPIHVGVALSNEKYGYLNDDIGDNISQKNKNYCELTALYWVWKNSDIDSLKYIGLIHYRRYFKGVEKFIKYSILSDIEIVNIMKRYDVIVPNKRKYYIETLYSHYKNAHNIQDLDITRDVIANMAPEYLIAFDDIMHQRGAFMFNMFVMRGTDFKLYAQWLFDILFEVERRTDIKNYDLFQQRVYGFLSELLFNVWIKKHKLKIKEIKVVHLEGDNIFIKGLKMFWRKIKVKKNI